MDFVVSATGLPARPDFRVGDAESASCYKGLLLLVALCVHRLHPARRPQDLGGGTAAPRPQRRRPASGLLQSFADLLKFVLKEPVIPARRQQGLFILLAPLVTSILALSAYGRDPVRQWLGDGRPQCRHPLHLRHLVAGRVRHHHGRLGVELEVRRSSAPCAPPRRWSPMKSRSASSSSRCCWCVGSLNLTDIVVAQQSGGIAQWARPAVARFPQLVLAAAVPDVRDFLRLGAGGNQPSAVRPAGSESELVAGLHGRVFLDPVHDVHARRVRRHHPDVLDDDDPVPRGLGFRRSMRRRSPGSRASSGSCSSSAWCSSCSRW